MLVSSEQGQLTPWNMSFARHCTAHRTHEMCPAGRISACVRLFPVCKTKLAFRIVIIVFGLLRHVDLQSGVDVLAFTFKVQRSNRDTVSLE